MWAAVWSRPARAPFAVVGVICAIFGTPMDGADNISWVNWDACDCTIHADLPCTVEPNCSSEKQLEAKLKVPMPQDLSMEYFNISSGEDWLKGVNISWALPDTSAATYIKGYRVYIEVAGLTHQNDLPKKQFCAIANMQTANITDTHINHIPKLRWHFDCVRIRLSASVFKMILVVVRVTSLPVYPEAGSSSSVLYRFSPVTAAMDLIDWQPDIEVRIQGPVVSVRYKKAPESIRVHAYKLTLWACRDSTCDGRSRVETQPAAVTFDMRGQYTWKLRRGCYAISVKGCRCRINTTHECTECSTSCLLSRLVVPDGTSCTPTKREDRIIDRPEDNPGPDHSTADPSTAATRGSTVGAGPPSANVTAVVAATLAALLVVAVVIVISFWIKKKGNNSRTIRATHTVQQGPPQIPVNPDEWEPPRNDVPTAVAVAMKERVRVLLVYFRDHRAHLDTVHSFAEFLKEHCFCDVVFQEWEQNEVCRQGPGAWMLRELDKASKVIIINSEGGHGVYLANRANIPCNPANTTPNPDLFWPSMRRVLEETVWETSNRILMTHFSYTPREFVIDDIMKHMVYEIPRHLDFLLLGIHDLPSYDRDGSIYDVKDCTYDRYHHLPRGMALKEAIEKAEKIGSLMKQRPVEGQTDSGVESERANSEEVTADETRAYYERWHHVHAVTDAPQDHCPPADYTDSESEGDPIGLIPPESFTGSDLSLNSREASGSISYASDTDSGLEPPTDFPHDGCDVSDADSLQIRPTLSSSC